MAEAQKKQAKKETSGKTITIRQVASAAGRYKYQRQTLIGLGLNKINRVSTLQDTPSIRGMIARVQHLIKIEG